VNVFSKKVFDKAPPKNGEAEAPQEVVPNRLLELRYTSGSSRQFLRYIRLLPVVACLYLTLAYVMSAFSFPLVHHGSSSRLSHPAHNHINICHISLLFHSQHHHSRLTYFRIYFLNNKIEKTII
jgi:hypothetical protein